MRRRRFVLPALLVVLLLGLAAGVAFADSGGGQGASTTATDPGASTAPPTTSATTATTTDASTTTAPVTSADTTLGSTTAGAASGSTGQSTTQAGTTAPPATTSTAPVAACETTQVTCGNNAATQVAVVSQSCSASSNDATLNIDVQTLAGAPIRDFKVNNNTTCLNEVSITQIVQQLCVGCTVIVIPPPPRQSVFVPESASPSTQRAFYCMPHPVKRADGSMGLFVDLLAGQPTWDHQYAGAVPATLEPGSGYVCPTGGGPPPSASAQAVFTLTVPQSFVGQYLNLCVQPADPAQKPVCHQIRIDNGATVTVPVAGHVSATVEQRKLRPQDRPKGAKQISAASALYAASAGAAAKKTAKGGQR